MEIIMSRIEREFNIDIIATSPSVIYEVTLTNGNVLMIDSPNKMPDRATIADIKEPFIKTNILFQVNILDQLWNCVRIKEAFMNLWNILMKQELIFIINYHFVK